MKKAIVVFFTAMVIIAGSLEAGSLLENVNPFIGTGGHGHTFPGATVPNGMVQLSPDTRLLGWDACGGYHYTDSSILGFSHTHLSGTGIGDYGDVLFMPFVGETQIKAGPPENPEAGYRSRFKHENEQAEPGYYQVYLSDYNTNVELTASPHAGFHKYTYPKGKQASLIIDLASTIHGHENPVTELRIINDREVEGYKRTRGWARNHHVYFHARFNQPFEFTLYENGEVKSGNWTVSSGNSKAVLHFKNNDDNQVLAKVGISAVDYAGARQNLLAEIPDWQFDQVRENASSSWKKQLNKIRVKGGLQDAQTIFYTALYHANISPYIYTDVDGRYRGHDQKIHKTQTTPVYTVFSLWDTFRALHPLLTITDPEQVNHYVRSLLINYDQGGMLPKWELAANYTGTMIGYHAVSVIVDAYMKGIRDYDIEKAYDAIVKSAYYQKDGFLYPNESVKNKINSKAKFYNDSLGYIPCDLINESVSKGLEYAYNDWCIAQMAKAQGKKKDATIFTNRAKNYMNYFDSKTGFMRGKNSDGTWKTPFDPKFSRHRRDEYTEGNAWQWTWFVPHDVGGLVGLMGGKESFSAKLDELFSMDSRITGEHASSDISGLIGQYAHGNEPSHHIAYLYAYIDEEWKTQEMVREILTQFYKNDPDGLIGNEDCGQMSAWYVLSALGFYPVAPGSDHYVFGTPMFKETEISLDNGNRIKITANKLSENNKYVEKLYVNGKPWKKAYIDHQTLVQGAEIKFIMSDQPNQDWFQKNELLNLTKVD